MRSREDDKVNLDEDVSDSGPLHINVSGGNTPGVTSGFSIDLKRSTGGSHRAQGEDTQTAPGTDTGDVKFQTADEAATSGRLHSNVSVISNTNDGQGNTVSSTKTEEDQGPIGTMASEFDDGEDDFVDANGQPTGDTEHDQKDDYAFAQVANTDTDHQNIVVVLTDPATGMTTRFETTLDSNDSDAVRESADGHDAHSQSGIGSSGQDSIGGDDDIEEHETAHAGVSLIITTDGTTSSGKQVHIVDQVGLQQDDTDDSVDDDAGGADAAGGHDTETVTIHGHVGLTKTETLSATITSTDPTTGIRTVVTDSVSVNGSLTDDRNMNEVDVHPSTGVESKSGSQSDNGSASVHISTSETTTKTDANGNPVESPTTISDVGDDTWSWLATHSASAIGQVSRTVSAMESGNDGMTNSGGGYSTWANSPVDSTTADQIFSDAGFAAEFGVGDGTKPSSGSAPASANTPVKQLTLEQIDDLINKKINDSTIDAEAREKQLQGLRLYRQVIRERTDGVARWGGGHYTTNDFQAAQQAKRNRVTGTLIVGGVVTAGTAGAVALPVLSATAVEAGIGATVTAARIRAVAAAQTAAGAVLLSPTLQHALENGTEGFLETNGDVADRIVGAGTNVVVGGIIDVPMHVPAGRPKLVSPARTSSNLQPKTRFPPRTNQQAVQDIADRAEAWGKRKGLPSTGNEQGTAKHKYAEELLKKYQDAFGDRGLSTEVRYLNGEEWQPGMPLKDSIKLDVVEGPIPTPTAVYDYKFGNATLKAKRVAQIRKGAALGPSIPVIEVKPK